jgi:hypothetical protein
MGSKVKSDWGLSGRLSGCRLRIELVNSDKKSMEKSWKQEGDRFSSKGESEEMRSGSPD